MTTQSKLDRAIEDTRIALAKKLIPREQRAYAREAIDLVEGSAAGEQEEVSQARAWLLDTAPALKKQIAETRAKRA